MRKQGEPKIRAHRMHTAECFFSLFYAKICHLTLTNWATKIQRNVLTIRELW